MSDHAGPVAEPKRSPETTAPTPLAAPAAALALPGPAAVALGLGRQLGGGAGDPGPPLRRAPAAARQQAIRGLQGTVGNRAVARLLALGPPFGRAKPTIPPIRPGSRHGQSPDPPRIATPAADIDQAGTGASDTACAPALDAQRPSIQRDPEGHIHHTHPHGPGNPEFRPGPPLGRDPAVLARYLGEWQRPTRPGTRPLFTGTNTFAIVVVVGDVRVYRADGSPLSERPYALQPGARGVPPRGNYIAFARERQYLLGERGTQLDYLPVGAIGQQETLFVDWTVITPAEYQRMFSGVNAVLLVVDLAQAPRESDQAGAGQQTVGGRPGERGRRRRAHATDEAGAEAARGAGGTRSRQARTGEFQASGSSRGGAGGTAAAPGSTAGTGTTPPAAAGGAGTTTSPGGTTPPTPGAAPPVPTPPGGRTGQQQGTGSLGSGGGTGTPGPPGSLPPGGQGSATSRGAGLQPGGTAPASQAGAGAAGTGPGGAGTTTTAGGTSVAGEPPADSGRGPGGSDPDWAGAGDAVVIPGHGAHRARLHLPDRVLVPHQVHLATLFDLSHHQRIASGRVSMGPVWVTGLLQGSFRALGRAYVDLGPVTLRNISLVASATPNHTFGRAELQAVARGRIRVVVSGRLHGTAHLNSVVELATLRGDLSGPAEGGLRALAAVGVGVEYENGQLSFSGEARGALEATLGLRLDATVLGTALGHEVWHQHWALLNAMGGWHGQVRVRTGLAAGRLQAPEIDLSGESISLDRMNQMNERLFSPGGREAGAQSQGGGEGGGSEGGGGGDPGAEAPVGVPPVLLTPTNERAQEGELPQEPPAGEQAGQGQAGTQSQAGTQPTGQDQTQGVAVEELETREEGVEGNDFRLTFRALVAMDGEPTIVQWGSARIFGTYSAQQGRPVPDAERQPEIAVDPDRARVENAERTVRLAPREGQTLAEYARDQIERFVERQRAAQQPIQLPALQLRTEVRRDRNDFVLTFFAEVDLEGQRTTAQWGTARIYGEYDPEQQRPVPSRARQPSIDVRANRVQIFNRTVRIVRRRDGPELLSYVNQQMESVYDSYFMGQRPQMIRTVLSEENLRLFQVAYARVASARFPDLPQPIRVPEQQRRSVAEEALPSSAFGLASRARGYGQFEIPDDGLGGDQLVEGLPRVGTAYVPASLIVISFRTAPDT
jgi:hypothetical protein